MKEVFWIMLITLSIVVVIDAYGSRKENAKLQSQVNEQIELSDTLMELVRKHENLNAINEETIRYQKATISVLEKTLIINNIDKIPLSKIYKKDHNGTEHIGYIISKDFKETE